MWNRIKNRLSANKSAVNVKELIDNIENVRKRSTILVLYGSPTNGSWLGIANATLGLFPNEAVEIPQWYSHLELNSKQEKEVLNLIAKLKFEKIIVSGFASFFFKWIDYVHASTQVTILFHGTISEFHDENRREFIAQLITYGRQNKINSFGFVKVGLAEIFNTLYGFKTYHQALNAPSIPENLDKLDLDKTKIHIGVFGADTFNKNLHNQVIHALLLENTVIHVLDKSIFSYLMLDNRIVEHGQNLPKEKFLSILGSMDLNLYLSYSESWGLVAYESEAMGVPCIKPFDVNYLALITDALAQIKKKE